LSLPRVAPEDQQPSTLEAHPQWTSDRDLRSLSLHRVALEVPEDLTLEASAPVQVVSVRAGLEEALKTLALEQRGTLVPALMEISDP